MSIDNLNDEDLVDTLEQILRSIRERRTSRSRKRYYLPNTISDWKYAAATRGSDIVLVSDADENLTETGGDISQRVTDLEKGFQKIVCDLDEKKKKLGATESLKNEALRQYKEKIAGIPEVIKVFYMISEDGIDFLTLFESSNRLKVLKRIVPLHVELDRIYKEVYFDFQVSHISDVEIGELGDWTLLYEKTLRKNIARL